MRERVVIGMSGGVDSSVAAALLLRAGYEVIGVSMRLWNGGDDGEAVSGCCSLDDFLDARRVADRLGIPFYVMDFQEDFRRDVVDPFVAEYAAGRTPNPCARCNQYVKFGSFWQRARELGATSVATGHYARALRGSDGSWQLHRGLDCDKDQSYFLFTVTREALPHSLFPVGHIPKATVRALAAEIGLPVAAKPDSQEVCFAPGRSHNAFLAARLGAERPRPGVVLDDNGEMVGKHDGIHTVTVGQRRGLGLQGHVPQYVTHVEPHTATVRVGPREALLATGLEAGEANWLVPSPPAPGTELTLKIRSRHAGVKARISSADAKTFRVHTGGGLSAVTPGQAAVLYDGDRVVGGGWIRRALRAERGRPS